MAKDRRLKILHIDDDEAFLETFRKAYGDEFDIVPVNGGSDVPEIVSREMPDALVLDYEIPGRNGLELLAAIKERFPSLPVIFYTGQGNEEIARQAFRDGATDYFVKRANDFAQKEKVVNSIRKALERKAVEEELAEKHAMLEGIIEYNPYSILITDRKGRPLRTNAAHTKVHGISPGPDGKIIFDESLELSDEVKSAVQKEWDANRETYSLFNDETALKHVDSEALKAWQDGKIVRFPHYWYSHPFPVMGSTMRSICVGVAGFSVKNSHGEIMNYVQMYEDITARVEAEEDLKKAHEDLTRAHDNLRTAYESVEHKVAERTSELAEANKKLQEEIDERARLQAELEKQNKELEGFSRTVSHDLRNSLNAMQRLMEKEHMDAVERRKTQELLLENTMNLQHLVERLLELAQAGRAIAGKRKVSLDETARKIFAIAASHTDAELCVLSPFPPVFCDPGAFEQIFSNLLNNALAYAQPDMKLLIQVGCYYKDGTAEITVRDNGKGIPPEIISRIFDSNYTTDRKEHFGLGLAIVKKLVEAHGGTVHAQSDGPGKGAAFVISIPNRP